MSSLNNSNDDIRHEKAYTQHVDGGTNLSRQITLQLNADQYERLFFQPTSAKGDLAKRLGKSPTPLPLPLSPSPANPLTLGNPTLLGLLGFLVPFSSTVFSLLHFQDSSPSSLVSISGTFYMYGGIAMTLAGIAEFILGNTFPFSVFVIFGVHWLYLGFLNDPLHDIVGSYATTVNGVTVPGALSQEYNAGQGNYAVVMTLICFVFFCASLRTNVPFVIVFLTLIFVFGFLAAGYYSLGFNPTAAGLEHATYYFKIAGGFGFVTIMMGW
jgi:succinate-acetate transporter protein